MLIGKKRQKHREEFGEIEFDDNTVFQMEHIIALMKEIDSKAGEMFEDDYRQNEPRHIAKDAKEERNNIELVRKVHEKAYNQLSGKEKIELDRKFFEKRQRFELYVYRFKPLFIFKNYLKIKMFSQAEFAVLKNEEKIW